MRSELQRASMAVILPTRNLIETAPRCEWRERGSTGRKEERTDDRSEHGGASKMVLSIITLHKCKILNQFENDIFH